MRELNDLELKNAELRLKQRELALKIVESRRLPWTQMLLALITLVGGVVAVLVPYMQQRNALQLERQKYLYDLQRAKVDQLMTALNDYSAAYAKGSTPLIIHATELENRITLALSDSAPSYQAAQAIADGYQDMTKEGTDWLVALGPLQTKLEVLTGLRSTNEQLAWLAGLPGRIDKDDPKKRVAVLTMLRRNVSGLRVALLGDVSNVVAFEDGVQKRLTAEAAESAHGRDADLTADAGGHHLRQ